MATTTNRPLGRTQLALLHVLREHGPQPSIRAALRLVPSSYYVKADGRRVYWETASLTFSRAARSLAARGLVELGAARTRPDKPYGGRVVTWTLGYPRTLVLTEAGERVMDSA